MENQTYQPLTTLTLEELRVLGSLIEKSRATPEYYPMTINSLMAACNQKTSRKPVMQFTEDIVNSTVDLLRKKGLVSTVVGGSSRVTKYKHNLAIKYPLVPAELSIIALLLLRGPLTPGEINNQSGRMYEFDSLDEVNGVLRKLSEEGPEGEPAFIIELGKKAGQKEVRFTHLLGGSDLSHLEDQFNNNQPQNTAGLAERLTQVEEELAILRAEFNDLIKQLT